jgi:hypothetical protein
MHARGSATVNTQFNCRGYSTDRVTNVSSRLNYLMKLSKRSINEQIRMDIYKILADPDFLFSASQNIKSQPGNMTSQPGGPPSVRLLSTTITSLGKGSNYPPASASQPDPLQWFGLLSSYFSPLMRDEEGVKRKALTSLRKSKRGGVSTTTLDGMSAEVITRLANDLKTEKFQFSPALSIHIPKALGSSSEVRPLTIAPPIDKIVQEGMRIILNAIFEPTFKDVSHGFRPNRSCHTALKFMKSQFQPCTWLIEGDISQCFPSIDHQRLMKIIEKKILDRKFTRLI